jgi:hypothetical protein
MPVSISGTSGITFPDGSLQTAAASPLVLRNRIINGAMVIDQRNAGASVTPTTAGGGTYTLDRWFAQVSQNSKLTVQQNAGSVTPPTGFTNYLGVTSSSAYSVGSGDYFSLRHAIEGFNVADLGWGTANASTVTLSFWVRSSLTGTFGGTLQSVFNSGSTRTYPYTYTISTANTWEYKTLTIAGDTTGTWDKTNGKGLDVVFGLGVGSTFNGTAGAWTAGNIISATGATSVVGTNGATFYITGVQLEQNTSATPFERRLYNQELANCQRYYWQQNYTQSNNRFGMGTAAGAITDGFQISLPVPMRTTPSVVFSNVGLYDGTSTFTISSIGANYSTPTLLSALINNSSSITAGKSVQLYAINSSASVSTSGAEL